MQPLPDSAKKLIEAKTYANVATLMPDGSPHVTQTWVDHDGDLILINTFDKSQKYKNAKRDPRIALDIVDPANPYNVVMVRGRVVDVTYEGAEDHIDRMAKKYMGTEKYEARTPDRKRVLIKIEPTHVIVPWEKAAWRSWKK
jgi:PPOX class probable F420-dependent enzyme